MMLPKFVALRRLKVRSLALAMLGLAVFSLSTGPIANAAVLSFDLTTEVGGEWGGSGFIEFTGTGDSFTNFSGSVTDFHFHVEGVPLPSAFAVGDFDFASITTPAPFFAVTPSNINYLQLTAVNEFEFELNIFGPYSSNQFGGTFSGFTADVSDFVTSDIPAGADTSILAAPTTVVPIPAALPLFLSGLLGLGVMARRRKQKVV